MRVPFALADVLADFVRRSGYTPGQLSQLSGIPKATIVNWLEGRVKKPRHWDALLQVAAALRLTEAEATRLLQTSGHPSVVELLQETDSRAQQFLEPWREVVYQRTQAPFQVIADLPYFVGRKVELQMIQQVLLGDEQPGLCCLQGMAGVGKSTLAVHAAYQLRPRFPDGVLWANVASSEPLAILDAFAGAYGQDVSTYADLESRALAVRDLLAHKRALLILDNVQNSAEIRPLLPPTGSCSVLLTSRRTDLWLTNGIQRITLHEFDRYDGAALELCTKLLGADYVHRHVNSLQVLLGLVGHLPLAVAIVASRLAYEPNWHIADFLVRMHQEGARLDELCYGDQKVYTSFHISYALLTPQQQRFFAALGALPAADFTVEAAAYVTRSTRRAAIATLRELSAMSLVQQKPDNRYRLHPLLHDYAVRHLTDVEMMMAPTLEYLRGIDAQSHPALGNNFRPLCSAHGVHARSASAADDRTTAHHYPLARGSGEKTSLLGWPGATGRGPQTH